MKKKIFYLFFLINLVVYSQGNDRIANIENQLDIITVDNPGLEENLKLDINVTNVSLSNFLVAISRSHQLNINVSQGISNITIVNNFPKVTIKDLLIFLCKEYNLTIEFTGNILSVKQYVLPAPEILEKEINVIYNPLNKVISMDLKNDPLEKVFRAITTATGENLLFSNYMANEPLHLFIKEVPLEQGLEKLAMVNNLEYSKSRDGYFLFSKKQNDPNPENTNNYGFAGRNYQILDTINKLLNVNFNNTPVAEIINGLALDLKLDVYTATPLERAGAVTFTAKSILFDDLLAHIFEGNEKQEGPDLSATKTQNGRSSRPSSSSSSSSRTTTLDVSTGTATNFTFKKENNIYFFGTADQLSLRNIEVIPLMHRSIELLSDPSSSGMFRSAGRTQNANTYGGSNYGSSNLGNNNYNAGGVNSGQRQQRSVSTSSTSFSSHNNNTEALVNILPEEIKSELDIKVDFELNSFIVSGPASKINRFKKLIKSIDRPVPVVLIEVMILEVSKSAIVETGVSWGIGAEPVNTQGAIFPAADLTLGANTVNKIIGGFDGFGSFNIGSVVPEFFAKIKALEEAGNIKIKSTPKLSTLNGHRAHLSIGETTYYVVTSQNFYGQQNPTTSEIRNYAPIDAELAISIKPLVSGDGQVTLDINVIQSDFSSQRIEEGAPPGLTSREFSSIIRMQNQDLAILGGLEEKVKNDSGTGVPILSRIPVIKWLFSSRRREDTKKQLSILIKPTVIY